MAHFMLEPPKAVRAKDDYFSLGVQRSLKTLLAQYREIGEDDAPTVSMQVLKGWHDKFEWRAYCAEREAMLAEKTEAVMEESRVALKQKRLRDQAEVIAVSVEMLRQIKEFITGSQQEVVPHYTKVDRYTGEPENVTYSIEWVPNLTGKDYVNLFPKVVAALMAAQKEQKQELGENTQRYHVTIEEVVKVMPPEWQAPMREALYESLMSPKGVESMDVD